MATSVGTIAVNVSARTGQFAKAITAAREKSRKFRDGLKKTKTGAKDFGSGLKSARSNISRFSSGLKKAAIATGVVVGAFLAIKKVVGMFGSVSASIDEVSKKAAQLGMSSPAALQGLQFAAEQSGASAEVMGKGLETMNRRVSDAVTGAGSAAGALKEMGMEAAALNQMSPDQQFRALADAIAGLKNPADQARMAYEVFGRDGLKMLNLLRTGAAGVNELTGQFDQTGAGISFADAALVEKANDAWNRFKTTVKGIVDHLMIHLAPAFEWVSDRATQMASWVSGKMQEWKPVINQAVATLISYWEVLRDIATEVFGAISDRFGGTMSTLKDFALDALIALQYGFTHWRDVAGLAITKISLWMTTLWEEIKHFFSGAGIAAAEWYFENLVNGWIAIAKTAGNVFSNIATNSKNMVKAIIGYLQTGDWNMAWEPLTNAFEFKISELKMPKRELSRAEKQLGAEIQGMEQRLGGDFLKFREKRRQELQEMLEPGTATDVGLGGFDPDQAKPEPPEAATPAAASKVAVAALQRGSVEAFSAITRSMTGTGSTEKKIEKNTAKQVTELEAVHQLLDERLAAATPLATAEL